MAIHLDGWLSDKFEGQLLLGNDWLQEKNRAKAAATKSEYTRDWRGLYHDNGSCLDIILSNPPGRNSALQVLQLSPLILTDGKSQVPARLDSACIRSLLNHFPPHLSRLPRQAVLAVRNYTIRYTSYGPPRHRLTLILHHANWIGISDEPVRHAVPLQQVEEISTVLQQLDNTRAAEDRRCLRPNTEAALGTTIEEGDQEEGGEEEEEEEGEGEREGDRQGEGIMAPIKDESVEMVQTQQPHTQQPHTQAAFATQRAPVIRSLRPAGDLQFLGAKSMEPVLAGNTKVEELRPAPADPRREMLLGLIKKSGTLQPPVPDVQLGCQHPNGMSTQASPPTPSRPLGSSTH
ncbi:hypothetical protein J1614_007443 [Plenodomus biglobosus]|nr:hypothetical protein J1614_007443 [Plenodomus biglobosus]